MRQKCCRTAIEAVCSRLEDVCLLFTRLARMSDYQHSMKDVFVALSGCRDRRRSELSALTGKMYRTCVHPVRLNYEHQCDEAIQLCTGLCDSGRGDDDRNDPKLVQSAVTKIFLPKTPRHVTVRKTLTVRTAQFTSLSDQQQCS